MNRKLTLLLVLLTYYTLSFGQLYDSTDKVGVGISNPVKKFQVEDGLNMKLSLGVQQSFTGSLEPSIFISRWLGTGTTYDSTIIHALRNGNTGYRLGFSTLRNHDDNDFSGYSTKMFLSQSGNLGIGTLDTGIHRLAVEGSIGAREIKVLPSGWSDYVFNKEYSLPTLEEVELYINQFGHLKDIPSAKDVEENGILLGKMDSKLLLKIEELTLYIIEQNKKIVDLQDQVKALLKKT